MRQGVEVIRIKSCIKTFPPSRLARASINIQLGALINAFLRKKNLKQHLSILLMTFVVIFIVSLKYPWQIGLVPFLLVYYNYV